MSHLSPHAITCIFIIVTAAGGGGRGAGPRDGYLPAVLLHQEQLQRPPRHERPARQHYRGRRGQVINLGGVYMDIWREGVGSRLE